MSAPEHDLHADLASLADGTLEPDRARELEARVAESADLSALLAEQRRAIEIVRSVQGVTAPHSLRERVHSLSQPERRRRMSLPSLGFVRSPAAVAGALVAACAAAALAVVLPGGTASPTVAQAAALAQRPATLPGPVHDRARGNVLAISESGVVYPYWEDEFGWKAVGARTDRLQGRHTTTVFYGQGGWRLGYSIVAGRSLSTPPGATTVVRYGVRLAVLHTGPRVIVTWLRSGHSCVLSGSGVPAATMERLASWRDGRRAAGAPSAA